MSVPARPSRGDVTKRRRPVAVRARSDHWNRGLLVSPVGLRRGLLGSWDPRDRRLRPPGFRTPPRPREAWRPWGPSTSTSPAYRWSTAAGGEPWAGGSTEGPCHGTSGNPRPPRAQRGGSRPLGGGRDGLGGPRREGQQIETDRQRTPGRPFWKRPSSAVQKGPFPLPGRRGRGGTGGEVARGIPRPLAEERGVLPPTRRGRRRFDESSGEA